MKSVNPAGHYLSASGIKSHSSKYDKNFVYFGEFSTKAFNKWVIHKLNDKKMLIECLSMEKHYLKKDKTLASVFIEK